jgi:hypothetical protein
MDKTNKNCWYGGYGDRFLVNNEGKLHSITGPAIIRPNGTKEYWVDDIQYTEEEYPQAALKYKLKQLVW